MIGPCVTYMYWCGPCETFVYHVWHEYLKWKEKLVLKLDILGFKGILMTNIFCSFCMYLVCYKLSISLAYPCFLFYYMNCDDWPCTRVGADAGFGAPYRWYAL